jgi:amidase
MSDRIDAFTTAPEMLSALRTKRASAVELLDLHRKRIERHNTELNAIVEPDFERARHDAEAADARRARGEDAPLLGLPMTLKESVNGRGLRTTPGMAAWKDFRSEHDAPVTTRVKGAGASVMAKTNVPQMLADWQSVNPVYGRTNNPWDLGRTPGGSTGGGAAALAAGLTPLEFGSDIGGSIRVPAAFCGVYGHRPSETAMPRSGQFPMPPMPNAAVVMGVQARSAADRRARLDVLRSRDDEWSRASQRGIESGAPDYVAWFGQREQYRAAWRAFFREWDVPLMPTFITPAYPHWDKPWPNTPESIKKTLDVNGKPVIEELGLGGFVRPPRYQGD